MSIDFFNLDIEPTNRCNAHCYFCPRDKTPHQGLMSVEVFDQTLRRALEFDDIVRNHFGTRMKVNLCGLGEPLLNPRSPEFVRKIRDAGFECSISTNGSLLDERRSKALLDAGLQGAEINVGEEGEDYERIYGLPFEKTCENVVRFAEMAGDQCQARIVLVNHRNDREHVAKMTRFWRARGLDHFLPIDIMNRGGALFVDQMQYQEFPQRAEALALLDARDLDPICPAPFVLPFVGYDGLYYLCCSDWEKKVGFGSVFETSFAAVAGPKLDRVVSREPICKSCNHDPVNRLTDKLRAVADGVDRGKVSVDGLIDEIAGSDAVARRVAAELQAMEPASTARSPRRLIPVAVDGEPDRP